MAWRGVLRVGDTDTRLGCRCVRRGKGGAGVYDVTLLVPGALLVS